jgi:hypothetical protein
VNEVIRGTRLKAERQRRETLEHEDILGPAYFQLHDLAVLQIAETEATRSGDKEVKVTPGIVHGIVHRTTDGGGAFPVEGSVLAIELTDD